MLFKNGKQYELKDHEVNSIYNKLNLPVRLTYTSGQIKKNRKNPIPDKPASINIPLKVSLRTKKGFAEWRYAENTVQDAKGNVKYTPHSIPFFGDRLLTEYDIEFIWFIYFCSPYCKNNALSEEQKKRPRFEIEDAIRKAEVESEKRRMVTKVNTMIYDLDVGMSEKELRKVAKAYFIHSVDNLKRAQIEIALEQKIFAEEKAHKQGLKRFLGITKADEELELKGKIQKAVDSKIIKYVNTRKKWVWIAEDDKIGEEICRITGGKAPYEALYDYTAVNDEFREALEDNLKGQSVIEKKSEVVLDRKKQEG